MSSQDSGQVLRLRRTDHQSQHLLLNVGRKGPRDLDLKLVGTDEYSAFTRVIKEAELKSLQERNLAEDLEEWKNILRFALLHQKPEGTLPTFLEGVETVAALSGSTFTITIRRYIDGIAQRLGTIQLKKDGDEEIEPLDWVHVAVATSDDLRDQLETLQSSVESQKDQIAKLTTELDMLVKAKKDHEDELLSKFAALLNAKKLKIRDQQRLLNGAKIDPVAAEEVSTARSSRASRRAGASRSGKRKANSAAPPSPEEQQDEDDDVATADGTEDADGASRREQVTPEPFDVDAATEDEDEDEEAAGHPIAASASSRRSTRAISQQPSTHMDIDDDDHDDLPPPRALPFGKKKAAAKEPTPPPTSNTNNTNEDEETDDDEL